MASFKYGANFKITGKAAPQKLSYAGAWQSTQGSFSDLAGHIGQGHPWMPALLDGNRKRWQSNANHAEVLALDIDHGMSLAEAQKHPFIMAHCGLGMESASSSPEHEKFRLVFKTVEPIEGWEKIRVCNRYLAYLVGSADPACKDSSRYFYGAPGRTPFLLNEAATLPQSFVEDALAWDAGEVARATAEAEEKRRRWAEYKAQNPSDSGDIVEDALSYIAPYSPGEGRRAHLIAMIGGVLAELGPEGESLLRSWDGGRGEWGRGGFDRILKSLTSSHSSRKASLGTLFYLAKQSGFTFPASYSNATVIDPSGQPVERELTEADKERIAKAALDNWIKSRKYTPTYETNNRFIKIDDALFLEALIYCIKSGLGTGKTTELERLVKYLLMGADAGILALGSRNALLLQLCKRLGLYHLHEDKAKDLIADTNSRIACCVDSLIHFEDSDFDGKILILDEGQSIVKHLLLSSTLKSKRDICLDKFEQAIIRASKIIVLDGNLADNVVEYIQKLKGDTQKVVRHLNHHTGEKRNIEFIQYLNKDGKVSLKNNSPLIRKLSEILASNKLLAEDDHRAAVVVSDSQKLLEAQDRTYTEQGFKVLRIDAKTLLLPETKKIISNIDIYLAQNKIDLLLMSPSVESGIDISIKDYFNKGFVFLFGVLDTDSQLQIMHRVRHCANWAIWCQEYTTSDDLVISKSSFNGVLYQQHLDYLIQNLDTSLEGEAKEQLKAIYLAKLEASLENPHNRMALNLEAIRNYERGNTRACLEYTLNLAGHKVTTIKVEHDTAEHSDNQLIKDNKKKIIRERAEAIFNADDISYTEAQDIKGSFCADIDMLNQADKAILKHRLPGIENTVVWGADFIRTVLFDDRSLISRLSRFWFLKNMDATKNRSIEDLNYAKDRKFLMLNDINKDGMAFLQALTQLNLLAVLDGSDFDNDSALIKRITDECKRSKRLQKALGRKPGSLKPIDWVGRLCKAVGIESSSRRKPEDKRNEKGGARFYNYTHPNRDPITSSILDCLDRSFDKYLDKNQPQSQAQLGIEARTPQPINYKNIGVGVQPVAADIQSLEAISEGTDKTTLDSRQPQLYSCPYLPGQPVRIEGYRDDGRAAIETVISPTRFMVVAPSTLQPWAPLATDQSPPESTTALDKPGVIRATSDQLRHVLGQANPFSGPKVWDISPGDIGQRAFNRLRELVGGMAHA